jgi:glycerophosphoryl diester phosphodiesterase
MVVSGGAKGVDSWAVEAAHKTGLATEVIEADWETHGRSAGPIRNQEIVRRSDEVAAFWDGNSRGTLNTIALAVHKNIPVHVYGVDGEALDVAQVMKTATEKGVVRSIERAWSKNKKG